MGAGGTSLPAGLSYGFVVARAAGLIIGAYHTDRLNELHTFGTDVKLVNRRKQDGHWDS
jgi:hypothetical protein